jgi:glycosyltransferase involved in cell wall biosynthesis
LYAKRNGIYGNCRFIGTLDDVRPCLYAADAFVMTSQWEGLPIAGIEAMSVGLPAILYDVYGVRDLLQDENGGLLIDPHEDTLVEALLVLANNPELRVVKGMGAREIIAKNYSLENGTDSLVGLYTGRCQDCLIKTPVNPMLRNTNCPPEF